MFLLILAISIITGIAQIISSSYDLKNPIKKGLANITIAGWFFYICTFLLSFMPAIQKAVQDSIDSETENKRTIEQEERDNRLRHNYDSSLVEMKKKFDMSSMTISQTLGKYGFKLDSTNLVLVNLKDSFRAMSGVNPVLMLTNPPDDSWGIELVDEKPGNRLKFRINIQSRDAGSSFFNIVYSFVVADSLFAYYVKPDANFSLDYSRNLPTDQITSSYHTIVFDKTKIEVLFLWVHGSYKRLDGTGNFFVDEVYGYYFKNKRVMIIKGKTKEGVKSVIRKYEK